MTVNTVGFVPITDGGVPRTISGKARETISGGEYAFSSGADNVVLLRYANNTWNELTTVHVTTDSTYSHFRAISHICEKTVTGPRPWGFPPHLQSCSPVSSSWWETMWLPLSFCREP